MARERDSAGCLIGAVAAVRVWCELTAPAFGPRGGAGSKGWISIVLAEIPARFWVEHGRAIRLA